MNSSENVTVSVSSGPQTPVPPCESHKPPHSKTSAKAPARTTPTTSLFYPMQLSNSRGQIPWLRPWNQTQRLSQRGAWPAQPSATPKLAGRRAIARRPKNDQTPPPRLSAGTRFNRADPISGQPAAAKRYSAVGSRDIGMSGNPVKHFFEEIVTFWRRPELSGNSRFAEDSPRLRTIGERSAQCSSRPRLTCCGRICALTPRPPRCASAAGNEASD